MSAVEGKIVDAVTPRTIGEMKLETQTILRLLVALQDGEVLTYDAITEAIGVDVRLESRHYLQSATRAAERETQRLYATVPKVGVKRLAPGESNGENVKAVESIHRKAAKAMRRSSRIDASQLTKEQRDNLNLHRTLLHFAAESTAPKSIKKIETGIVSAGQSLPFAKTLGLFEKK